LALPTSTGLKFAGVGGPEMGFKGIFSTLAKDDLYRSVDVAKSLSRPGARAIALLIVAGAILNPPKEAAPMSRVGL
jgi:hypothetical protein